MSEISILLVSTDGSLARLVRSELTPLGSVCVCAIRAIGESYRLVERGTFDVVVLDMRDNYDHSALSRLIATCESRERPLPVVALAENYIVEEALCLFRLGISDYLGLTEHRDRLPNIVGMLTAEPREVEPVLDVAASSKRKRSKPVTTAP